MMKFTRGGSPLSLWKYQALSNLTHFKPKLFHFRTYPRLMSLQKCTSGSHFLSIPIPIANKRDGTSYFFDNCYSAISMQICALIVGEKCSVLAWHKQSPLCRSQWLLLKSLHRQIARNLMTSYDATNDFISVSII